MEENGKSGSAAHELERLAALHREGVISSEEYAEAKKHLLTTPQFAFTGIRRRSSREIFRLPLWSIAIGPDPERNEMRGHARGILALGDIATGVIACGGLARGILVIGGISIGVVGIGGCSIGLALAIGGAAVGGIALGGLAVGYVAIGGGAFGYYALGGAAFGAHVISAMQQDPAAIEFFRQHFPWIMKLIAK